jgi:hypothetical protein
MSSGTVPVLLRCCQDFSAKRSRLSHFRHWCAITFAAITPDHAAPPVFCQHAAKSVNSLAIMPPEGRFSRPMTTRFDVVCQRSLPFGLSRPGRADRLVSRAWGCTIIKNLSSFREHDCVRPRDRFLAPPGGVSSLAGIPGGPNVCSGCSTIRRMYSSSSGKESIISRSAHRSFSGHLPQMMQSSSDVRGSSSIARLKVLGVVRANCVDRSVVSGKAPVTLVTGVLDQKGQRSRLGSRRRRLPFCR